MISSWTAAAIVGLLVGLGVNVTVLPCSILAPVLPVLLVPLLVGALPNESALSPKRCPDCGFETGG
jgi:hypothetical protein